MWLPGNSAIKESTVMEQKLHNKPVMKNTTYPFERRSASTPTTQTVIGRLQKSMLMAGAVCAALACSATGVSAAGPAAMQDAAADFVQDVQRQADGLRSVGFYDGELKLTRLEQSEFNAAAVWSARHSRCEIQVRMAPVQQMGLLAKNPLWRRFVVMHEMAHCELLQRPEDTGAVRLGLDGFANRLIHDVLTLDTVKFPRDTFEGPRESLLALYHETYADGLAILELRQEIGGAQGLGFIRALRGRNAFNASHETSDLVSELLNMPQNRVPSTRDERRALARSLALLEVTRQTMRGQVKSDLTMGLSLVLGDRLRSGLADAPTVMRTGLHLEPYFAEQEPNQADDLRAYPLLPWLRASLNEGLAPQEGNAFAAAWLLERYGMTPAEFLEHAHGVSVKLERMAQQPGWTGVRWKHDSVQASK